MFMTNTQRYTDFTKTIFVTLYFAPIYPFGYFILSLGETSPVQSSMKNHIIMPTGPMAGSDPAAQSSPFFFDMCFSDHIIMPAGPVAAASQIVCLIFCSVLFVAALFINFNVDKYCLLRVWKQMPKVDSSITRTSRGHFSLAILIHVIIALHYYAQVGSSQRLPSHTNGYLVTDSRWRACHIIRMVVSLDDWSVTAIVALRHVDDVADSGPSTRSPRPAATRRGAPRSIGKPRRPTPQTLTRTRSTRTRHLSTRSNYIIQNAYVYYIYTFFN